MESLDRFFHLKERGTNVKTEFLAALTTFVTVAYVLAVNPTVLADAGMDHGAIFTTTALIAAIGTLLMGLLSNYPFVVVPDMALNAFFTYTVVVGMGYTWQAALAAVLIEGLLFILISVTKLRDILVNAVPATLKVALIGGLGLFLTIVGLKGSGLMVSNNSTFIAMVSWHTLYANGGFTTAGVCSLLAIIGVMITAILIARNVKGNILIGIVCTWVLGMICQLAGWYVPDPASGFYSLFPDFSNGIAVPSIAPVAFKFDFSQVASVGFITVVIAMLLSSVFDVIGTLIGTASQAHLLNEDGSLEKSRGALLSEALGITLAGVLGNSPTCVGVESSAGVAEGGRTGLTAVFVALFFGVSLVLSPLFLAIPSFATAPALITVGFMMFGTTASIAWNDATEGVPAFIMIIAMPFFYSIAEGIFLGIISYVVINGLSGKENRKKVTPVMWVLCALFILKYFFV